jgi:hypothetical protein
VVLRMISKGYKGPQHSKRTSSPSMYSKP